MKWLGPWPSLRKIQDWLNAKWGENMVIKPLVNELFMIIFPTLDDKKEILSGGP